MKAVKVGDIGTEHDGFHPTKVTAGSPNVFIDGKFAALTGGSISCGGVTIGSGTVNIGDVPPPATAAPAKKAEEFAVEQASAINELPVENMVAMNGGGEG